MDPPQNVMDPQHWYFCLGLNLENPDSLAAQAKDYATQYGDSFLYFCNYVVDKSRGIESQ